MKFNGLGGAMSKGVSSPTRGTWIEIAFCSSFYPFPGSSPTRGTWIEIMVTKIVTVVKESRPPHGGRGLK